MCPRVESVAPVMQCMVRLDGVAQAGRRAAARARPTIGRSSAGLSTALALHGCTDAARRVRVGLRESCVWGLHLGTLSNAM